jgi:hypothetical protein
VAVALEKPNLRMVMTHELRDNSFERENHRTQVEQASKLEMVQNLNIQMLLIQQEDAVILPVT